MRDRAREMAKRIPPAPKWIGLWRNEKDGVFPQGAALNCFKQRSKHVRTNKHGRPQVLALALILVQANKHALCGYSSGWMHAYVYSTCWRAPSHEAYVHYTYCTVLYCTYPWAMARTVDCRSSRIYAFAGRLFTCSYTYARSRKRRPQIERDFRRADPDPPMEAHAGRAARCARTVSISCVRGRCAIVHMQ